MMIIPFAVAEWQRSYVLDESVFISWVRLLKRMNIFW